MSIECPRTKGSVTYLACDECRKDGDDICNGFFLLVAGSRSYTDYEYLKEKLDRLLVNKTKICIVSGGARGADFLAERYAKERGYFFKEFPADWSLGKAAGYIRNREMYEFISQQKDRGAVIFWDGQSPGTEHSIKLAEEFNVPLRIVRFWNAPAGFVSF